jgi:cysteine synthase A
VDCNLFLKVPSDDAVVMARRLAVEEGLFCGISSGDVICNAPDIPYLNVGGL